MPGAALPSSDAVASWQDNIDNWRSADADFLQRRSVLRFTTSTTRNVALGPSAQIPSPQPGQVTYIANGGGGNGGLEFADSTGSWRSLLSVANLGLSDTSAAFGFRLLSDSSSSISLETQRVVLGSNRILAVNADRIILQTGTAAAELYTNTTSLVSSIPLTAPSASLGSTTVSSLTSTGALSTVSVTASGAISGSSLAVSTSSLGVSSAASLTASAGVTGVTLYGSTSVRGGSVLLSGSRAANNSASNQYLDVGTSTTTLAGDGVVLATTSQTTPVRYRTTSGAPFALVVVSSSDPGVSNYPDGTLWIQT